MGTLLSFATFAVGFVVRPLGGFVFGHFGDRIGRKRTLALTMALMGGGTALMGALPTAVQIGVLAPVLLLVLRVAQGFALGGEWAGAVLLAVEHSPRHRRGLFGSVPQIGLALGSPWAQGFSRSCKRCCHRGHSTPMGGEWRSYSAWCWWAWVSRYD
ncbi:MAG: hypothetical protein QOF66_3841 [Mycobacterium sp.]|nr:hypothetical protein [Mycobacterium sp.]